MKLVFVIAVFVLVVLSACTMPQTSGGPQWKLTSARELDESRHLIVTVPLSDPEELSALAKALERDHTVELESEWPLHAINVHCFVFRIAADALVAEAEKTLSADPRTRTVQRMQRFETLSRPVPDNLSALQDSMAELRVPAAHDIATGKGVRIALVDTGLDAEHFNLAPSIGLVRDFVGDGTKPEEHGTAIAGVIAANAGGRRGIIGVAPDAEILALRGCWEISPGAPGRCSSFTLARALNFALGHDVNVLNLSLGGPHDPLLSELVETALQRNITVITASGNGDDKSFPTSVDGVTVVAAGPRSPEAVSSVSLLAPGVDVLSTAPQGAFDFFSGSSIAAAHVSGITALLLDLEPDLTPEQVRWALGKDNEGAVDACVALLRITHTSSGSACEAR